MIEPQDIAALAAFAARHGVERIECRKNEKSLVLRLPPRVAPPPRAAGTSEPAAAQSITARIFGRFRHATADGDGERRRVPFEARRGDILGFLHLASMRIPVRCPCDGSIVAAGIEDDALVGFGDVLFGIVAKEMEA